MKFVVNKISEQNITVLLQYFLNDDFKGSFVWFNIFVIGAEG